MALKCDKSYIRNSAEAQFVKIKIQNFKIAHCTAVLCFGMELSIIYYW